MPKDHKCPDKEHWRYVTWYESTKEWVLDDGEYPGEKIVACPYCGVKLEGEPLDA